MTRRKAFTLVEILVVIGITGIVFSAGIAPLTYTIRLLSQAQEEFNQDSRERMIVNRIFSETLGITSLQAPTSVKMLEMPDPGEYDRGYLAIWSMAPAYTLIHPIATVVDGVRERGIVDDEEVQEGLYRWVLSGDVQPGNFVPADLELEEGRLVIPDVKGVLFQTGVGDDWGSAYMGGLPVTMRIVLQYEDEKETIYERILPTL